MPFESMNSAKAPLTYSPAPSQRICLGVKPALAALKTGQAFDTHQINLPQVFRIARVANNGVRATRVDVV
eukprot:537306-Rhodomonas_salina.1